MRVNVEDSIMSDQRFLRFSRMLDGDIELALGCMIRLWHTAAVYWVPKKRWIPKDIFIELRHSDLMLECKLVVKRKTSYYAIGTDANFAWIIQKHEAGLIGARARWGTKKKVDMNYGVAIAAPCRNDASILSIPSYQSDPVFLSNQSRSIESSVSAELDTTEVPREVLIQKNEENKKKIVHLD
jgi:hypothetical protein